MDYTLIKQKIVKGVLRKLSKHIDYLDTEAEENKKNPHKMSLSIEDFFKDSSGIWTFDPTHVLRVPDSVVTQISLLRVSILVQNANAIAAVFEMKLDTCCITYNHMHESKTGRITKKDVKFFPELEAVRGKKTFSSADDKEVLRVFIKDIAAVLKIAEKTKH